MPLDGVAFSQLDWLICNTIWPWFEFLYYFLEPKDQNIYMKKLFKTAEKKHTTFVSLLSRDNKFLLITFLCQQRTIFFDYNRTCRNEKVTRTCEKAISTELYICIKNIQTAVLLILEMTSTEKLTFPSEFQNLSRMTRFWKRVFWCWQGNSVFGFKNQSDFLR